jgi:hypothetical protein
MKEAIHDLECALEKLGYVDAGIVYTVCEKPFSDAKELIRAAVTHLKKVAAAELQHSRWETPEQYQKRTGKLWPDNGAVYTSIPAAGIKNSVISCARAKELQRDLHGMIIVCATEAGPPPPDDRKPEETE